MPKTPRPRHYVSNFRLALMRPLMRYSYSRDAYVFRVVGDDHGPVLRQDRRRRNGTGEYDGRERRGAHGPLRFATGPGHPWR